MKYHLPANVAYVDGVEVAAGEVTYLTTLPRGQTVRLEGIARQIWTLAVSGQDAPTETRQVRGDGFDDTEVRVIAFLEELVAHGLLAK